MILQPNIEADPLLIRTIVACLEFEPLLSMLLEVKVPLEVIAAALIHYMQASIWFNVSVKQVCQDYDLLKNCFYYEL